MSSDWRNRWRQSRWVTIADFPLLTLDINPETYEGGHPDAGRRGDELLKQAFAAEADRIGIKLRMRIQHGYPLHKARHLVRMSCHPGEYRPDDMDREVFMRDAIAFAVDEGWAVPEWLRSLIVDAPSSVVSPITSNQSAGEQGAQEYTGYLLALPTSRVLTQQSASDVEAGGCSARRTEVKADRQGVSKSEILAVFPPLKGQTADQWERMLGDMPQWMESARIDAGGKGIQSRWNPAELAKCLEKKGHMGRGSLGSLIRRCFPEYLPEWEPYAGSFD